MNSVAVESLAAEETDSSGVTFVSAFQGLFAPYWNAEARGCVCLSVCSSFSLSVTLEQLCWLCNVLPPLLS